MFMCGDLGRGVSLRMESTSARMPGRDDALLPARDDARVPLPAAAPQSTRSRSAPRGERRAARGAPAVLTRRPVEVRRRGGAVVGLQRAAQVRGLAGEVRVRGDAVRRHGARLAVLAQHQPRRHGAVPVLQRTTGSLARPHATRVTYYATISCLSLATFNPSEILVYQTNAISKSTWIRSHLVRKKTKQFEMTTEVV